MQIAELRKYVEENNLVTINKISPEAVGALLYLARHDKPEFQKIVILGLKHRLQNTRGNTSVLAAALPAYVTECRVKLALTMAFMLSPDLAPVPMFSMSFLDENEHRQLRECELLAFGKSVHHHPHAVQGRGAL